MGTHSHVHGKTLQIRSIEERLTPAQQQTRQAKILARRTVAERLAIEIGRTQLFALAQRTQFRRFVGVSIAVTLVQAATLVYLLVR